MIKTISSFLLCVLVSLQMYAQAPDAFQYQALVRNTAGAILAEADVTVTFKLHHKTATNNIVFIESHQATTTQTGIVSLQIGKGTITHGSLTQINWADGPYFIETEVSYGAELINVGTQQLMSVPFAKYATHAENVKLTSPDGKTWAISVSNDGVISTTEVSQ